MSWFINFAKKHKIETYLFTLIMFVTVFLRLCGLGYSHFYGDETKTFYLDKTVPASQFFLDQRKGPVQFLVVWFMEKLVGGFSEFWMRFPFALAGIFSVVLLYILIRRLFNARAALLVSFLYSINGFYVAFSRIVQYQSFLMLLGLLALLFVVVAITRDYKECPLHKFLKKPYSPKIMLFLSSIFLSLAFLTHFDALFFAIPIFFILIKNVKELGFKNILIYFILPLIIFVGVFYFPYIRYGYLQKNTVQYISRRVSGRNFTQNYSPYTIFVYNPLLLGALPLLFAFLVFFKTINWRKSMFLLWFVLSFIAFQFVFLNPGTHIHVYLAPLLVLAGVEFVEVFDNLKNKLFKRGFLYSLWFLLALMTVSSMVIYLPRFSSGYPWVSSKFLSFRFPRVTKKRHLFLYGFPYNRAWDQVQEYMYAQDGIRAVYTNDNATIAEYYLGNYDITPPGSNYIPQYYVYIFDGQEFKYPDVQFLQNYELEKEFFVDGVPTTFLFKKRLL